jgi:uncharacterized SAM-binding protein YcdF (DUF218 family)
MFARFARAIGFLTMTAGLVAVLLLAGGFFWFAWQIQTEEAPLERSADGIVVLTGAAARIPDAIELLAAERGKRLLISGVHRDTRAREIASLTPLYSKLFNCCIDLDRSALNTFGNAIETKRWAVEHNFNSLIIVTSNWHMPRAMAEMRHQLPQATLIPYPVISEKVRSESW